MSPSQFSIAIFSAVSLNYYIEKALDDAIEECDWTREEQSATNWEIQRDIAHSPLACESTLVGVFKGVAYSG